MSTVAGTEGVALPAEDGPARAPTILDLAALAGVSKTTVSRVLNGSPRVAPSTRATVLDAVDRLGFQVNQAARSLRTSRTGLVGVMVPIISIFGVIVEELDRALADEQLSILMTTSRRRDPGRDRDAIEMLVGRGADALVIAPSDDRSSRLGRYLKTVKAPIVVLDRELRGVRADVVLVDQEPGLRAALEHLLASGRRQIGLLSRDRKTRPGRQIIDGYAKAAAALGYTVPPGLVLEFEDLDRQAGRDGVDGLIAAGADAIVSTGTMEHTASVLERLGEHGLLLHRDVSLVMYGHLGPVAQRTGLPTIAYPVEDVAALTKQLLLERLGGATAAPQVERVATRFLAP
jgi:LacI family transcriptional regulator